MDKETKEFALLIADKLKMCMKKTGMTVNELSDKVGVHRSYISRILNAKVNLSLKTVAKLFHAVGVDFEFKLEGTVKYPKVNWVKHLIMCA